MKVTELDNSVQWLSTRNGNKEFYINPHKLHKMDSAYVAEEDDGNLQEVKIAFVLVRSKDEHLYDGFVEDLLEDISSLYNIDCSCEFLTCRDKYLFCFKYLD